MSKKQTGFLIIYNIVCFIAAWMSCNLFQTNIEHVMEEMAYSSSNGSGMFSILTIQIDVNGIQETVFIYPALSALLFIGTNLLFLVGFIIWNRYRKTKGN